MCVTHQTMLPRACLRFLTDRHDVYDPAGTLLTLKSTSVLMPSGKVNLGFLDAHQHVSKIAFSHVRQAADACPCLQCRIPFEAQLLHHACCLEAQTHGPWTLPRQHRGRHVPSVMECVPGAPALCTWVYMHRYVHKRTSFTCVNRVTAGTTPTRHKLSSSRVSSTVRREIKSSAASACCRDKQGHQPWDMPLSQSSHQMQCLG